MENIKEEEYSKCYVGICNHCADRQYERHLERQEWDHYHCE